MYKDLDKLEIKELNDLLFEVKFIIEKKLKKQLKIGDIISVNGDEFFGEIFEVLKINHKKIKCERENGEIWNIPHYSVRMC